MRFWHWLLLGMAVAPVCFGLQPGKRIHQYRHRVFRRENGLPNNAIRNLAQTPDGYLWVATTGGLTTFDGDRFVERYAATGAYRTVVDAGGDLWAVADGRVLRRRRDGEQLFYGAKQGIDPKRSVYLALAATADGGVWALDGGGELRRFDGHAFVPYAMNKPMPRGAIRTFSAGAAGDLWVAYYGLGLVHVTGHDFRLYGTADGLPTLQVTGVSVDGAGKVWIGSSAGAGWLDGAGRYEALALPETVKAPPMLSLLVDREGALWLGTRSSGLLRRSPDGSFDSFSAEDGLSNDTVSNLFEDAEGNLWAGTYNGVDQFTDLDLSAWTKPDGVPYQSLREVCVDGAGNVHALGYQQVPLVKQAGGFVPDPAAKELTRAESLACEAEGAGSTVAVTGKGVYGLENGAVTRHVTWPGFETDAVRSLAEGRDGTLWIGTLAHGVKAVRANGEIVTPEGLQEQEAFAILPRPDGAVWVGTARGALVVNTQTNRAELVRGTERRATVTGFAADGAGMWISGSSGLQHADSARHVTTVPAESRFGLQAIYNVVEDNEGYLWLEASRGLVRVKAQDVKDLITNPEKPVAFRVFGPFDGQAGEYGLSNLPLAKEASGRLWFTTTAGLLSVDPGKLIGRLPARPVLLEEAQVDGKRVDARKGVPLSADAGRLAVSWTAAALARPDALRFQYRLDGFDRNWVDAGAARSATYTSLSPGEYRLRVRANYAGAESELAAPLGIKKAPHAYQTGWFRGLCVLALGLLAWGLHLLRMRQLRHEYGLVLAERTRIARELHDTVLQGFTGLVMVLQGAALRMAEAEPVRHTLEDGLGQARGQLREARRAVWELRAAALEEQDLPAALRAVAGLEAGRRVLVEGEPRPLRPAVESVMLRVAQEALANAAQHAKAERVEVRLVYERRRVSLTVRDDGIGFETEKQANAETGHFGLQGMKERVEGAGGRWTIVSAASRGTEVRVEFPLRARPVWWGWWRSTIRRGGAEETKQPAG